MTEKRYFIIDVEETHQENAVWQYDDKLDDYDFVCFEDDSDNLLMKLNELAKVNKQLKAVLNEVLKLLEEEVDLFSDKATEHDLNAFRELREFDNKDAYYIAIATKKAIKLLKELQE